jgi:ABC-type bacteriocin/lantibiotic exporter with double-glycine peptidase domain
MNKHPFQKLLAMLSVDKRDILYLYAYSIFYSLVSLTLPLGIQAIIGLIQAGTVSINWIILSAIVTIGVIVGGILQVMQLSITEIIQQRIFTRAAFEFTYRIPRFQSSSIRGFYPPEMINKFFDTLNIQKGLPKLLMDFSSSAIQIIIGLILLSTYHPFFITFGVALILLLTAILYYTGPRGLESSLQESTYKYRVAHWLQEIARTMDTFKRAGHTELPLEKTDGLVQSYLKHRKKHWKTLIFQFSNIVAFKALVTLGLLVIGGLLVIENEINIGQFVASEIVIILIVNSAEKLILTMEPIYDVLTAVEKISRVTDIPLEEDQGVIMFSDIDTGMGASIDLKGVTYTSQNGKLDILKDLNVSIESGARVVITGPNGSGKSTLLRLLSAQYEATSGTVSYNGQTAGNLNTADLRYNIGDCFLSENLFEGTLLENITLGRPEIELSDVEWAVNGLGLKNFIMSLPMGYETPVGPTAIPLSSSLIERILLARAIITRPRLLLVDDVFHLFDPKERKAIIDFIWDEKQPWTLVAASNLDVVCSHSTQTIKL